jgi:coenzyme PQQ precursor peptide PqqA
MLWPIRLRWNFNRKCHQRWWRKIIKKWETPTLVEICIGLEINGYLPAEF